MRSTAHSSTFDEVADAIVVNVDDAIRLFVVLACGATLDDALTRLLAARTSGARARRATSR